MPTPVTVDSVNVILRDVVKRIYTWTTLGRTDSASVVIELAFLDDSFYDSDEYRLVAVVLKTFGADVAVVEGVSGSILSVKGHVDASMVSDHDRAIMLVLSDLQMELRSSQTSIERVADLLLKRRSLIRQLQRGTAAEVDVTMRAWFWCCQVCDEPLVMCSTRVTTEEEAAIIAKGCSNNCGPFEIPGPRLRRLKVVPRGEQPWLNVRSRLTER